MTAFLNALLRREVFAPGMGLALGLSKRRGGGAPASPVNPTLTSGTHADQTNAPDTFSLVYSYAGADTLVAYGITSTSGTAPSKSDIVAGTGTGTLEEFVVDPFSASTFNLTGLTSTSESATHIHIYLAEKNNGGESAVVTGTVTGLDFTLPAFSSAETDPDGNTITITTTESVSGTPSTGDFSFSGISAGTPTIDSVTVSGTSITIEISGNLVANGDTVTVSYTKGGSVIVDGDGNEMASFTNQSVTNNVSAGGLVSYVAKSETFSALSSGSHQIGGASFIPSAGTYLIGLTSNFDDFSLSLSGSNISASSTVNTAAGGNAYVRVFEVTATAASTVVVNYDSGTETSFFRFAAIYDLGGASVLASTPGTVSSNTVQTVSQTGVNTNDDIVAFAYCDGGNNTLVTWGGDFASGDKDTQSTVGDDIASAASVTAASTGTFTSTATVGTAGNRAMVVVRCG